MLDLSVSAVEAWFRAEEGELAFADVALVRPSEGDRLVGDALVAFGRVLGTQLAAQPDAVCDLLSGPALPQFRALLQQLGPARLSRLLDALLEAARDRGRALVATVVAAEPLSSTLNHLNRRSLLGRMFADARVEALLAAGSSARKDVVP